MGQEKKFKLYAIVYNLKGDNEQRVAYATSYHPTTKAVLKRTVTLQLKRNFPEHDLHNGMDYFEVQKEQLLESYDGWNIYNILPKKESSKNF